MSRGNREGDGQNRQDEDAIMARWFVYRGEERGEDGEKEILGSFVCCVDREDEDWPARPTPCRQSLRQSGPRFVSPVPKTSGTVNPTVLR
jgi:hypothetical protein